MKKSEWTKRYVSRLRLCGLTAKEAIENLRAFGKSLIDFDINPEEAADDEISYMKEESR